MYSIPSVISKSGIIGLPFDYEWNGDIAIYFNETEPQERNVRLQRVIDKCGYKACFSMAIALSKWFFHRLEGHVDLNDLWLRIYAMEAGAVDRLYIKTLDYSGNYIDDQINGPLWSLLCITRNLTRRYVNQWVYMRDCLINMITLFRYISNNNNIFDKWVTESFQKIVEIFPWEESDPDMKKYDASQDNLVPLSFFFEGNFHYDEERTKNEMNEFLTKLNYKQNPYLRIPNEMKEKGFTGIPYTISR